MPEYLAPGVYVEEQDTGIQPIEGVSTSTAGFVGVTQRGPVDGPPALVTSYTDYARQFGSYFDFGLPFLGLNSLPHAVQGFFTNGGKRLYIRRVKGIAAGTSTKTAQGYVVTRLAADTLAGSPTKARLASLRGIENGTQLNFVQVKKGLTTTSGPHTVNSYDRNTNEVTLGTNLASVFEVEYTTVSGTAARVNSFVINAADPGSWGDSIDIQAFHMSSARSEVMSVVGPPSNNVLLRTTAGFYVNAVVEFDRGQNKIYRKITAVNGLVITVDGAAFTATALDKQGAAPSTLASVCEFVLNVSFGDVSEQYRGLTLENVPGHYYYDVINASSSLIRVTAPPAGTAPANFPAGDDGLHVRLAGGSNGAAPGDPEFVGTDGGPGQRTGIQALKDIEQISLVAVPGIGTQLVQEALIDQCELLKYRVALLDPKAKAANQAPDLNDIQSQRNLYDSKYAAIYFPRVMVFDPLSRQEIPAPPSGFVAGICARVDEERGVFKPPANEIVRGILDLERILNKGEQDILNPEPNNINVLRNFRANGRGLRVWGARCITSETLWKYLNVRRLFIFLEASLDHGTQWAVFEPNDERLWARVRQSITNFLIRVWRDGALFGSKQEEAFFVKCDRTTMTQDDIDNGRLIIIVGVAPVKPAEFVIIRIGQKAGLSTVEEI